MMNRRKMELLAPAGSFDSLKAAVQNGADAVYLGGGKFNARINAGNFSKQELVEAFDYAHERGCQVYVALNTLVKNEELSEALEFAAHIYEQGADAVIIQDMGLLNLLRREIPNLPLHASTQMTVVNKDTVKVLEGLGVQRIVLARELSLEEIRSVSKECRAELEVFVHGALCVCYSGQCLMSSFIGSRSGNRGLCAQPCRLPWSLKNSGNGFGESAYLLSPRDLMALELLPLLKEAGVASLKLEGRMKSPEYVAIVTSVYRKYLDLLESGEAFKVSDHDRDRLLQAFNRGGFTQSYLQGSRDYKKLVYARHPKNQGVLIGKTLESRPTETRVSLEAELHMGDGIEVWDEDNGIQSIIVTSIVLGKKHARLAEIGSNPWIGDFRATIKPGSPVYRTMSKPLFEEARLTYERGENRRVPIEMTFRLALDEPGRLTVKDPSGIELVLQTGIAAEMAVHKPLSPERIEEQLGKTKDAPYEVRKVKVETDGLSTIPISALNALRREALESLREARIRRHRKAPVRLKGFSSNAPDYLAGHELKLSAFFYLGPQSLSGLGHALRRVYVPLLSRPELSGFREQYGGELYVWTPGIAKDHEMDELLARLEDLKGLCDGVAVGNAGLLKRAAQTLTEMDFCAEPSMNVFNNEAISLMKEMGIKTCVLSPELRLSEVKAMHSLGMELEAVVYGRIPLMTMEHCPSACDKGCTLNCSDCRMNRGFLKDRKGEIFPFIRDPLRKRTQILNAFPLFMDDAAALRDSPLSLLRLYFTFEDNRTVNAVVSHYAGLLHPGTFDDDSREPIRRIKDEGITKGHWFRGV